MQDFRPLQTISRALTAWARGPAVQTTVAGSGRVRAAVDSLGIALGWMSRGYQYDTRTFLQRMSDKNARYHLKDAARAILGRRA